MSLDSFIPKIWSARLLRDLEARYVYADLTNRNWEGEIANYGDTVRIHTVGDVDVNDYVKNTTEIDPQELDGSYQELEIDQAKYFAFKIDDIDVAQQRPKIMDEAIRKSSRSLAEKMDDFVTGFIDQAGNTMDPQSLTVDDVPQFMGQVNQMLDEANVDPNEDRFIVVPPFLKKLIVISWQSNTESEAVQRNGQVGRYFGLDVRMSTRVPQDGDDNYKVLAGTREGITLAEQIVKTEAYRPENSFSDAVKGLHVYGGRVVQPDALLMAPVSEGS